MHKRTRPSFIAPPVHPIWTTEQIKQRLAETVERIADEQRAMNKIDSQINQLLDQKKMLQDRVSRGNKYVLQLKKQLQEQEGWQEL